MSALYRPDYRRARELTKEIEAACQELQRMQSDDRASAEDIRDLRDDIHHLQRALFLCGVPEVEA
jgi:hypothetical protein